MKEAISILGVPMRLGQTRYGTNLGPESIRSAGIKACLESFNEDVIDIGDIEVGVFEKGEENPKSLKNLKAVVTISRNIAQKVSEVVSKNRFPLILGGDHSISIGTLAGVSKYYHNLGVIWYDAHGDMNTPETTPSGNIHGMPLAASMGLGHPELINLGGYTKKVKPANIVLIGIRDLDVGEKNLIAEKQIKVFTMDDIKRHGIARVMQETIEYLSARCDGVHLSFDLDVLDPRDVPGVGTPVENGISYAESIAALNILYASGIVTSAEFVEVNPLLDKENRSSVTTVSLVGALFGHVEVARQEHQYQKVSKFQIVSKETNDEINNPVIYSKHMF